MDGPGVVTPGPDGTGPEGQREQVPRDDTGELDTALAFLAFAQSSVLKKAAGLDDEQLRRVLVPTGTTLLGLVRHLTDGQRFWFGVHLLGVGEEPDWDAHMGADDLGTAEVLDGYRASIAEADEAVRSLGDLDALSVGLVDGRRTTLRWVVAHMTSETARHAGHADILRELVDGTTGR